MTPFCPPEPILRGVSNSIEGVRGFPSILPRENIKGGDSSSQKSLVRMTFYYVFGKSWKGGEALVNHWRRAQPSSNSTQKILSLFWGKFEGAF
jgi:hypothetical protein